MGPLDVKRLIRKELIEQDSKKDGNTDKGKGR